MVTQSDTFRYTQFVVDHGRWYWRNPLGRKE